MNERSIFAAALDIADPAQRSAYLDEACSDDPQGRRHIDELLAAEGKLGSFLARPPVVTDETGQYVPITERPGTVVGPYKLLEQIGEGGMGLVFVAEQQQPVRRKVALKLIKPGMDTREVIARFEAERQALALMDHPNIAKVLDAGTTDSGRPYFVMELVKGVPITDYCDQRQLTPAERLEFFVSVCQAVQHAHTKGVIHRDLKPSNILIAPHDGKPVVKVIDFGVAKAIGQRLTDKTIYTRLTQMIGTPLYMSPEQAEINALDVDTRSDVYSLGVLLYELLTGTTPFDRQRFGKAAFDEIRRIIREEEPPKPSTRLSTSGAALAGISQQRGSEANQLTRLVRGELDWIVMRCLEKDRTRRYETANALARDVERYLKDEPVEACPPTVGYKLRKFARKHKRLLATVAAFAALLLLGVAASAWQAVRATQAEEVANTNAVQAQDKEREANQQRDDAQKQRDEAKALAEKLRATQAQLRNTLYAAHMNLAQHAWDAGGIERVRELLAQQDPRQGESDLRGFEWHYLDRLCHAELLTLKLGPIHSIAFSPDGKRLAGADAMRTVRVWDARTGQELLSLQGQKFSMILGVTFSPDGKRLAGASSDGTVKVWDAQTGKELLALKGRNVAYSPDGKRLASGGREEVKVWDAQTGQGLLTLKGGSTSVAFSPDGKRLASTSLVDKTVKVWDAQTGQELLTLKGGGRCVAFSPDGKRLASILVGKAKMTDAQTKVWDAQNGKELLSLKGGGMNVAFSPDGKRLACPSSDGMVKVWDAQTGQELLTFKGNGLCVAFSPDGKHLAGGGFSRVRVWDVQPGNPLIAKLGSGSRSNVAFSPDGKRLACGRANNTVMVLDVQTGQEVLAFKGGGTSVAFSPDGTRLAGGGVGVVKVWDAQTSKELLSLKGGGLSPVFSPDGKRLASAGKELRVWDARTGQKLLALKGNFWSVAFSPDGKRLASGGREVKVWDAQTGKELLSLRGHTSAVPSVSFSPDGKRLASASRDKTVKVWDAQTGKELLKLKGHTEMVYSVAFSPDGKRVATGSEDKTVKVWDAQTGQELFTLKHTREILSVAFSPDGHRMASIAVGEHTVRIWDATPLPEKP